MSDPRHDLLRSLFDEALELPQSARAAFADARCGADPEMHERLSAMLAGAEDDHFLRAPTVAPDPLSASRVWSAVVAHGEGPGTQLGSYRLLERLGEGGFGTVFLAEQLAPVARRVAVKVLKLGMDSREVVQRFERERQALTLMDHPNIARVLDAGATESGRPYFVMDLVQGVPITEYCDREALSIDARLALFTDVCEAVQHAHQKGVVHRDLKPSNILVATQDGRPVAKVIDFGIAKATSPNLRSATLLTELRQVIGTLQYMSPEQAESSADVDTRADVYSLGALLYELLTGTTPLAADLVQNALFGEVQRMILEVDPPKPSTRLGDSPGAITRIAARRRIDPKRLGGVLRGELDWIVMRALEKDRARRYQSPRELAEDLHRHRSGAPVVAAPPSKAYQLRKFVRRNRGLVAALVAVAGSLLLGLLAFAWQARIASRQRDEADLLRDASDLRAAELAAVVTFQDEILGQIDPTVAGQRLMRDVRERHAAALAKGPGDETARSSASAAFARELARVNATDAAVASVDATFLAPAVSAIAARFADQPLVAATLRRTLAGLYVKLGRFESAEALLRLALDTHEARLGADHRDTLLVCNDLADVLSRRGAYADAEPWHRRSVAGLARERGPEHVDTLKAIGGLGGTLRYQGKFAEAEPLLRDAVDVGRRALGAEHRDTLILTNTLGYVYIDQGRLAEAEPYWRETYTTGKRVFGPDDPDVIVWTNNFAGLLQALGRESDAEAHYREALAASQRVRGHEHPGTAMLTQNVANILQAQKRHGEAEQYSREALALHQRLLGDEHPDTLRSMTGLSAALIEQNKLAEAEPLVREARAILQRSLGEDHPQTLSAGVTLARFLQNSGQAEEAEALYRDLLTRSLPVWGEEHDERLMIGQLLGNLLLQQRRLDEAEAVLRETLATQRKVLGDDHADTLLVQATLASVILRRGDFVAAEADYRDIVTKMRRTLGDEHATTLSLLSNHAQVLLKLERFEDAEPLLREAAAGLDKVYGNRHDRSLVARSCLARALIGQRRFAEGDREFTAALAATDLENLSRRQAYSAELAALHEAWHAAEPTAGHDVVAAGWRERAAALKVEPGK